MKRMKNWRADRFRRDCPEYVIAHAMLQASKGRNPCVPFLDERNPRKALQLAQKAVIGRRASEQQRERDVALVALMLQKKWRMDKNKGEFPSVDFNVIHAEDLISVWGLFSLYIAHVNSFHGKGFKAILRHARSTCETGDVQLGQGAKAFNEAMDEGQRILAKHELELAEEMKKQRELEFRFHRGR